MTSRILVCIGLATLLTAAPAWGEAEVESEIDTILEAQEEAAPEPAAPPVLSASEPSQAPAATGAPAGRVARATFTTDVLDREPQDSVSSIENDHPHVFYFSELEGMTGRTITHRWEHDGVVMAEVPFTVAGPRWRVFSRKNLDASWLGEWSVSLVDESGDVLRTDRLSYTAIVENDDPEIPAAPEVPAAPAGE